MKRNSFVAIALALLLGTASGHAEGTMGGLGFRTANVPGASVLGIDVNTSPAIGIRHWFSQQAGVDVGFGFTTVAYEVGPPTTDVFDGTGFAIDVGVPFCAKEWDKVKFIVRPGFLYSTTTLNDKQALGPPDEAKWTAFSVSGELEVEYMIAERLSISASHGIAYRSLKFTDNDTPENEETLSGIETTGSNFTQLGFHVYLW